MLITAYTFETPGYTQEKKKAFIGNNVRPSDILLKYMVI